MPSIERIRLAYNNVYVVPGAAGVTLIDTGPDYRGARETLDGALGGRRPERVIATHGHLDHAGLGHWWAERGVPVALGARDLALARGTDFEFEAMAGYVRSVGAPGEAEAEALDGLRTRAEWNRLLRKTHAWTETPRGRWPTNLHYERFEPESLLEGETELPGGLRAIPCAGHTPGNLVVYHEDSGSLFSGDQLLPEITPTPAVQFHAADGGAPERFPSLPRFLESLAVLQRLSIERCYPGHGEPFGEVQAVIAANLAQAEQRTARLAEVLRTNGPGTVYVLAEHMYPRALRRRFWQIVSTVQGHLDVLAELGEASSDGALWVAN